MTIRAFWKRGPPLRLIKRTDIPPDELFTSDEVRRAVRLFRWLYGYSISFLFYGHLVFMPVAWLLIQTWPPYHHAFVVTDWIADRLPSTVFGILTVTQAQLDEVGARLPRAAYIHFIVEQIVLAAICLVWSLTISVKMWRIYPFLEAHARHIHVNYDEYRNTAMRRKGWIVPPFILGVLYGGWWIFSSPDRLLYMIEKGNGFGLLAINAIGAMWVGVCIFYYVGLRIISLRGVVDLLLDR